MLTKAIGGENPWATEENHRLEQCKLLTRGPAGKKVVVYRNPGAKGLSAATLEAVDDDGATFSLLDLPPDRKISDKIDDLTFPKATDISRKDGI